MLVCCVPMRVIVCSLFMPDYACVTTSSLHSISVFLCMHKRHLFTCTVFVAIGSALSADLSLRRQDLKMIAVYCPSSLSSTPLTVPSSSAVDQLALQGHFPQPQPSPRPSPKSEHCIYDAINQVPSVARERSDSEVSFSGPLVYPTKPPKPSRPSPLRLNTSVDDAINTSSDFMLPTMPFLPPLPSTAPTDGLYKSEAPYIMTEYEPSYASNVSNVSMVSGSSPSVGQKRKIMNTSLIHQVTSGAVSSSTQSFFHSSTSSSSLNKPPAAAPVALDTGVP